MSVILQIPTEISQALRLPPAGREQQLLKELALALYSQEILSFGKARELAEMSKRDFGLLLGQRGIPRHYDKDDLQEDLAYGGRQ